jgi:hypothetical protein
VTADETSVEEIAVGQQERHLEYRQNDKEVRMTIVRVIADHLRDHEYCWSACDFDLRTAHLEDVDFSHAVFGGTTQFGKATFSGGPASFTGATFSGDAWFGRATFSGLASFATATFSDAAGFYETTFSSPVSFAGTDFGSSAISFEDPQQWGPPAPTFDWSGDVSTKPDNVTPQNWPPTPIARLRNESRLSRSVTPSFVARVLHGCAFPLVKWCPRQDSNLRY